MLRNATLKLLYDILLHVIVTVYNCANMRFHLNSNLTELDLAVITFSVPRFDTQVDDLPV